MLHMMEGEEGLDAPVAVAEESTKVKDDDIDSDMPPHDLTKLEQLSEVISYCCNVL
jgi:hypothetical protein